MLGYVCPRLLGAAESISGLAPKKRQPIACALCVPVKTYGANFVFGCFRVFAIESSVFLRAKRFSDPELPLVSVGSKLFVQKFEDRRSLSHLANYIYQGY